MRVIGWAALMFVMVVARAAAQQAPCTDGTCPAGTVCSSGACVQSPVQRPWWLATQPQAMPPPVGLPGPMASASTFDRTNVPGGLAFLGPDPRPGALEADTIGGVFLVVGGGLGLAGAVVLGLLTLVGNLSGSSGCSMGGLCAATLPLGVGALVSLLVGVATLAPGILTLMRAGNARRQLRQEQEELSVGPDPGGSALVGRFF